MPYIFFLENFVIGIASVKKKIRVVLNGPSVDKMFVCYATNSRT